MKTADPTADIRENINLLRQKISAAASRVGRQPDSVRLLAVSKKFGPEMILAAAQAGLLYFGENFVQEAAVKLGDSRLRALDPAPQFHFIGHLQSNKTKLASELFDVIQTVDRLKLARALDTQLRKSDRIMPILIQVNVAGERQKSGVAPADCEQLLSAIRELPHLSARGLMTMPPYSDDPEESRPCFRQLRLLAEDLTQKGLLGINGPVELSMGMSGDFEVAVEEGATIIRVGTAIFGSRS